MWSETGKLLVNFWGADIGGFGERLSNGEIVIRPLIFSSELSKRMDFASEAQESIAEVLDGGFITWRSISSSSEPLVIAFLPVTQVNHVTKVLLAGHRTSESLPKDLLNVYLALAGLVGTTAERLASEAELRKQRRNLERQISEREYAEEALREREQFLSNIFESIQDGISILDSELNIVRTNSTIERWYSAAMPLVGKKCFEAFHNVTRPCEKCPVTQALKTGKTTYEVVPRKGPEGHIDGWLELYAFPLTAPGSDQVMGVIEYFRDISDRKKAEEALWTSEERHRAELEQRIKERTSELGIANERLRNEIAERKRTAIELERSNAELQQFAYVASHDLQEPLRMVSSYVQLLERRYRDKLDDDADEFMAYAVDGAKRMQGLINGLLKYSRVGTHVKAFESVDCETVLDKALANLRMLLAESGAQVTRDPLPAVNADFTQLLQLFQNLIDNACKFRDDESPQIHISARLAHDQWLLSVRDNGIGIDPEYAERIFVIFQRLHNRGEFPGTGLGLAICKKIVERHGGKIWVEPQNSKGTTFCFTIPERKAY
ncbi:MAG: ATP-binding protein [Desulfomonilaceae bacterium]